MSIASLLPTPLDPPGARDYFRHMDAIKKSLVGSTALVTGGAQRIGRAIALALAGAGADVAIHCHESCEAARDTLVSLRAVGVRAWLSRADLSRSDGADALMEDVLRQTGGALNLLVNNASAYPGGRLDNMTVGDLDESVRLHAFTPLVLARRLAALAPSGHVVNLLDTRVTMYDRDHAAYHLGKRMLLTLTRMLALELAPGIQVNAVAPGAVLPPAGQDTAWLDRVAAANPMQRHGTPQGVAECVLFLMQTDFITGQIIYYDGGYHMKAATYA